MTKIAIYPGSFDPVTYGHIDIIERASRLTDRLIIGVLKNSSKTPLFSTDERVKMLSEAISYIPNVTVESFEGLTVEFAKSVGANAMIRGLRAVTDFEYELQLSQTNKVLEQSIDTIFLTTNLKYSYLSSTITKEIAVYGGDISRFVPPNVEKALKEKLAGRTKS